MTPAQARRRGSICAALVTLLLLIAPQARAQGARELIEESLRRHELPTYVYQEQTLIVSGTPGQLNVLTLRYYARRDARGVKRLAMINTPEELRGMTVLVTSDAASGVRKGPAPSIPVFGSNLTVADFEGVRPGDFAYELDEAQDLDRVSHHVVKALPKDEVVERATGYGERRIFLRKDNLFMSRMDFLDRRGRIMRRQTFRDPRPDESGAWRANMILIEDLRADRRTLLKIERRVHSPDSVPDAVFGDLPVATR